MGRKELARSKLSELDGRIEKCEEHKKKILEHIHHLKDKCVRREISYHQYEESLAQKHDGKTLHEWLDFHDSHIQDCKARISRHHKSERNRKILIVFYAFFVISLLMGLAFFIQPRLSGYSIKENTQDFSLNVNQEFSQSSSYNFKPEISGRLNLVKLSGYVSGKVKIYLDDKLILDSSKLEKQKVSGITGGVIQESYSSEQAPNLPSQGLAPVDNSGQNNSSYSEQQEAPNLPSQEFPAAENITQEARIDFKDICEESCDLSNLNLTKESYDLRIEIESGKLFLEKIAYEIISEEQAKEEPVENKEKSQENKTIQEEQKQIENLTQADSDITLVQGKAEIGKPVQWKAQVKAQSLAEAKLKLKKDVRVLNDKEVKKGDFEIEYETPAPQAREEKISDNKKKIIISNTENATGILTHISLDEKIDIKNKQKIKIKWTEKNQNIDFTPIDNNNDGLIEQVDFIAPEQGSYEVIIEISNAEHLDSSKIFIENIYEQVSKLDGIWSPEIKNNEYVRVTFRELLTNRNDITLYPRIISGNPRIEVYSKDSKEKIAEFSNLVSNNYSKIFLTNLVSSQDTFDLRVVDGSLVLDHIIDPNILVISGTTELCGEITIYTTIHVTSTGTLAICNLNATGKGWLNISLGLYGNFTVDAGGKVNGAGRGGNGGAGSTGTTGTGTQGRNGATGAAGGASTAANGGGGGGGKRSSNAYGDGGAGGGFGGLGGKGGNDSVASNVGGYGGQTYGSATALTLFSGSGGGGGNGDNAIAGASGGAGIKVNASSGFIYIQGIINMTGTIGTAGAAAADQGAGGGGSGGHVILIARTLNLNSGNIAAIGGNGGNTVSALGDNCGGGGGGGGRIVYLYESISQTSFTNTTTAGAAGTGNTGCENLPGAGGVGSVSYQSTSFPTPDLTSPLINIVSPLNNSNNSNLVDVNYYVSDANLQACWWSNDTYSVNGSLTCGTNITDVVWGNGQHNLTIWANDSWENRNASSITFYVDSSAPVISLINPLNNTQNNTPASNNLIDFYYNATDYSIISNCSLIMNGLINKTSTNIAKGIISNLTSYLANGQYNWTVNCTDSFGNLGTPSEGIRNFSVNLVTTSPPEIVWVSPVSAVTLNEGPSSTKLVINFTAYDANGASDLNDLKANINLSMTGEVTRQNLTCAWLVDFGNYANFTCDTYLWWFDGAGSWDVNASIEDNGGLDATNDTTDFSINLLTGFQAYPSSLAWNQLLLGGTNITSTNDPYTLNNTGNDPIEDGSIRINATNLKGETINTQALWAGNFSSSTLTGGTCTGSACTECGGTGMISNYSFIGVSGAVLGKGNYTIGDGTAQEQLYFCLRIAGSEISQQSYSTSKEGAWTIKVFLALMITRKLKKKKRQDSKVMIKTLNLILKEQETGYSEERAELIKLLSDEIKLKYKINQNELFDLVEERKIEIPLSIFTKEVGALESLARYMKENLSMRYSEIASVLKKNERTIWTACNQARKKKKEPLNTNSEIKVPLEVFDNPRRTVLEALISYLKLKHMRYVEIARAIGRDQRDVWLIYSRAIKK